NFMASNIGLLAKRGEDNHVHLVATDLTTSVPLAGVEIELRNFQNQKLKTVKTDKNGFADAELSARPFYLVARKGDQVGYLKLSIGSALPTSHFDVGGEKVREGIKGYIYGERGVWRPGDDIYLTFVLEDKQDKIPDQHPVTMELYNAKGQLVESKTNTQPVGDFYKFKFTTAEQAETGTWRARAILGGNQFTKNIKIETVVPNRLKIDLSFPAEELYQQDMPLQIGLSSQWLHGAIAAGLKSEVAVRLIPTRTRFSRNQDYRFDDPARQFSPEKQVVFEGELDAQGHAKFSADLKPSTPPPGMLTASFNTRVFESGGAFSTNNTRIKYHPYENYVGIKLPKGDAARNMLLTDKKHKVEIASLDAKGNPVSLKQVRVTLYKVNWKWWWDQSGDNLAQYASSYYNQHIQQSVIETKDGRGEWEFEVKYPQWGRYMIRACDLEGNHCTGQVFYIDWPAWAGKAREQKGIGANVLSFSADKPKYTVGETATIKLPEATQGRALVTVENGSHLLSQQWIEVSKEHTTFPVKITESMSPNVYVSVSLIQPHAKKDNDRPIRLFGVTPLIVADPKTELAPQLKVAEEWKPESKVEIGVKETNGKAMTYTIAVVDEGLLGLTNYRTPDLHGYFYKKEALGVKTWDLFDDVTGAYGGELERLLSLGGDADLGKDEKEKKKRRFPPVVKFLGPFKLAAGQEQTHSLVIPQYLGQVRVMLVAGNQGAYGKTEQSVFVRQPLGLLATLPRVLGPDESLRVPVSLFSMDDSIKAVQLKLEADEHFNIVGDSTSVVRFDGQGEQIGFIDVKVADKLGKGHLKFIASSGEHTAQSDIYIDIRSPNAMTTRSQSKAIQPGEAWITEVKPHGIGGTNKVSLEVSAIPPLNLEGRLQYLIRYPHGCLEQTTSAIFPQLFLGNVMQLTPDQKDAIQKHVDVAIQKIQRFQQMNGAFNYWPGASYYSSWSNSYAGHFLVEADHLGYYVPPQLLANWIDYQKSVASSWVTGSDRSLLDQAYRLYTLAVANKPELGAMNRLRESTQLDNTARWLLAAAYQKTGLADVASELVRNANMDVANYKVAGNTFGSNLRDKAIILESLALMKRYDEARPLADEIARELSADRWYSTQSVAFSLIAMGHFVGEGVQGANITFEQMIGDTGQAGKINVDKPVYLQVLKSFPDSGDKITLTNTSDHVLYSTISVAGIPRAGEERSSRNGIGLLVEYVDLEGDRVDITKLRQGTDFVAKLRIRNHSDFKLEHLALTHIMPSGWQIHNPRMSEGENDSLPAIDYQDIRDDRVLTYFDLKRGEEKTFKVQMNASFLGRYYLPGIHVEAMYDASKHARSKGKWVEVVK
ncbi:MAG: MG2 domain-containing protein, partial [Thioalkalispiraceae bacterium]